MGVLIDGIWKDQWYDTEKIGGRFVRWKSRYRNWITPDGVPGPTGAGGFAAQPGRYHLYVSYACPWAHRTLIMRALKGLESMVSVSVTNWHMGENGWTFEQGPGVIPDPAHHARTLYQIYLADDPKASGRATTPLLWDKQGGRIVSNESADIMRMFNSAFDRLGAKEGNFYPQSLRAEIDVLNARIYDSVNNGVYKAGFATTQDAYEEAASAVFEMLDELDARLSTRRYLLSETPVETDWRLFTTLVRFDAVYFGHFKCNVRRLIDYPNLSAYARDLFQIPGVAPTVHFDHIRNHYYGSHKTINPTGIIPLDPQLDFTAPHGRERVGKEVAQWSDYTFEADLRSSDPDSLGVLFRYQDNSNYYRFSMDRTLSQRRLVKKVNGTYTLLHQDTVQFSLNTTYRIAVTVLGNSINISIDGQPFYSGTDTSVAAGTVAFYCWRNSGATFDNVIVRSPTLMAQVAQPASEEILLADDIARRWAELQLQLVPPELQFDESLLFDDVERSMVVARLEAGGWGLEPEARVARLEAGGWGLEQEGGLPKRDSDESVPAPGEMLPNATMFAFTSPFEFPPPWNGGGVGWGQATDSATSFARLETGGWGPEQEGRLQ